MCRYPTAATGAGVPLSPAKPARRCLQQQRHAIQPGGQQLQPYRPAAMAVAATHGVHHRGGSKHSPQRWQCKQQARRSSGCHGGAEAPTVPSASATAEPCALKPRGPSALDESSGSSDGARASEGSSNDGDMWACLVKLFRVVTLKKSHLRHWLKALSLKGVSTIPFLTPFE